MAKEKKGGILDWLGLGSGVDEMNRTEDGNKTKEPTIADLQKQIADLNSRFAAGPTPTQVVVNAPSPRFDPPKPPVRTKPDFTNLPDPGMEPEKYAEAYGERLLAANDKYNSELRAYNDAIAGNEQARENRAEALWADFKTMNKDYADPKRASIAAELYARDLKARGTDVDQYMISNSAAFFEGVKKEYDALWPKTAAVETREDPDPNEGRGESVFGGQDGSRGSSKEKDAAEGKTDLIADMKDLQRASGL